MYVVRTLLNGLLMLVFCSLSLSKRTSPFLSCHLKTHTSEEGHKLFSPSFFLPAFTLLVSKTSLVNSINTKYCMVYYRRSQNRVTDLKREGESLGIAAAGGLMLLLWDMKKGREAVNQS